MTGAAASLTLGLAACYESDEANYADNGYNAAGNAAYGDNAAGYAAGAWPEGARIVVEEGVTYRVDPDGTRIVLAPSDSRIVVEEGVRFRVDPDGTRVRIDEQGAAISVGTGADVTTGNTTVTANRN